MSKLGTPEPESPPLVRGLTDEVIVEHLKACQAIVLSQVKNRIEKFAKELDEQLIEQADHARSNQEQSELFEQLKLLQQNRQEILRYFNGYLGECFIKFKKQELATSTGEEKYQGDMLSLVDNEDLEETIAITSITHRAENHYSESLWALNQRFAVLNGGRKVDDRGNPAGPVQYCESLRKALKRASLNTKTKIIAYKVFDRVVVSQLADVLEELNASLSKKGILPDLHYRPATNDAPPVAHVEEVPFEDWNSSAMESGDQSPLPQPDVDAVNEVELPGMVPQTRRGYMPSPDSSLPSAQYQGHLLDAIRTLQSHLGRMGPTGYSGAGTLSPSAGPAPGASVSSPAGEQIPMDPQAPGQVGIPGAPIAPIAGATPFSNQQLVGALQNIQGHAVVPVQQLTVASAGEIQPQSVLVVGSQLTEELKESSSEAEQHEMGPNDMHTIELVGMLFDYMLSDDNLPDSVKALLSYLHTPFLKIAFIDKDFFEQTEHPARLLLNNMAEAGVKWVSNDGSSQYDIFEKIQAMVSRVLDEFRNDVRLFAELLLEFSGYTKKISRRQELMERRAMEKVQGEEKLREVKVRVNQVVRERTDGRELPSAVLLMLLQPWSDYMAFLLLRYGDESDSWQRAVQVIDDVLWSIEPKERNNDKTRQLEMLDELLAALESGFETIGYDQAKGKKLLEALFSLQKMALQSKQVEPAPAPMRDKLEAMAAEKAGHAVAPEDQPTPEELRMVEHLKMIEFGTWFEFEGGKRLKVAWYNSKTLYYMLVDQMGKKVAMKSGLELARDMLANRVKVIAGSSKPFFERALENIFQSLNEQAVDMDSGQSAQGDEGAQHE